ncbi:unnamed protein product, partial [Brachionus calyciflorus]
KELVQKFSSLSSLNSNRDQERERPYQPQQQHQPQQQPRQNQQKQDSSFNELKKRFEKNELLLTTIQPRNIQNEHDRSVFPKIPFNKFKINDIGNGTEENYFKFRFNIVQPASNLTKKIPNYSPLKTIGLTFSQNVSNDEKNRRSETSESSFGTSTLEETSSQDYDYDDESKYSEESLIDKKSDTNQKSTKSKQEADEETIYDRESDEETEEENETEQETFSSSTRDSVFESDTSSSSIQNQSRHSAHDRNKPREYEQSNKTRDFNEKEEETQEEESEEESEEEQKNEKETEYDTDTIRTSSQIQTNVERYDEESSSSSSDSYVEPKDKNEKLKKSTKTQKNELSRSFKDDSKSTQNSAKSSNTQVGHQNKNNQQIKPLLSQQQQQKSKHDQIKDGENNFRIRKFTNNKGNISYEILCPNEANQYKDEIKQTPIQPDKNKQNDQEKIAMFNFDQKVNQKGQEGRLEYHREKDLFTKIYDEQTKQHQETPIPKTTVTVYRDMDSINELYSMTKSEMTETQTSLIDVNNIMNYFYDVDRGLLKWDLDDNWYFLDDTNTVTSFKNCDKTKLEAIKNNLKKFILFCYGNYGKDGNRLNPILVEKVSEYESIQIDDKISLDEIIEKIKNKIAFVNEELRNSMNKFHPIDYLTNNILSRKGSTIFTSPYSDTSRDILFGYEDPNSSNNLIWFVHNSLLLNGLKKRFKQNENLKLFIILIKAKQKCIRYDKMKDFANKEFDIYNQIDFDLDPNSTITSHLKFDSKTREQSLNIKQNDVTTTDSQNFHQMNQQVNIENKATTKLEIQKLFNTDNKQNLDQQVQSHFSELSVDIYSKTNNGNVVVGDAASTSGISQVSLLKDVHSTSNIVQSETSLLDDKLSRNPSQMSTQEEIRQQTSNFDLKSELSANLFRKIKSVQKSLDSLGQSPRPLSQLQNISSNKHQSNKEVNEGLLKTIDSNDPTYNNLNESSPSNNMSYEEDEFFKSYKDQFEKKKNYELSQGQMRDLYSYGINSSQLSSLGNTPPVFNQLRQFELPRQTPQQRPLEISIPNQNESINSSSINSPANTNLHSPIRQQQFDKKCEKSSPSSLLSREELEKMRRSALATKKSPRKNEAFEIIKQEMAKKPMLHNF